MYLVYYHNSNVFQIRIKVRGCWLQSDNEALTHPNNKSLKMWFLHYIRYKDKAVNALYGNNRCVSVQ